MKSGTALQKSVGLRTRAGWCRPLATIVLGATMVMSLQGCLGLMVGGTVVGTLAATDRRPLGTQTNDATIAVKGEGRAAKIVGDAGRVNVVSFNQKVLLTGEVKDQQMKAEVERQIATIDGVESIENDLAIGPVLTIGLRSADTLISGKVKAAIIDTKDLYIRAFKVHTDRGVVYLMGRVTQREGKRAAEVVRNASGDIKKVVKLFEYITEDELVKLSPPRQEESKSTTRQKAESVPK